MRRFIRALWVIVLVGGGVDVAAAAGFDAAKIADIKKAGEAFQALGKNAYQTGQPPRQSDPAVAKLLDTIFDTSALNGPPPVTFAQFLDVNNWLMQVVNTGLIYVTAGTGIADLGSLQGVTAKQQAQMNANVIAYAPEMGRYYDAQLGVSKVEIDLVNVELAAHPDDYKTGNRAQGIGKMRSGLAQTLEGVIETFQLSGVDPAWLRDRLPPLAALAPTAAKFLLPDQKQQVHDLAVTVAAASSDNAIKTGLNSVAQALAP
ncbi:MAG TPA: hypothetical protein VGR70_03820 [Stellaceae bacterium]|nr:hypothetical protein [Stellaceae bacterium]